MKKTQWFGIALGFLTTVYAILYCVFIYTDSGARASLGSFRLGGFLFGDRADWRLVELSLATA